MVCHNQSDYKIGVIYFFRGPNAIFTARNPSIWGEGTTSCASDSKKFGSWDQNLMTEWHIRYGGRGVMIYWHVENVGFHVIIFQKGAILCSEPARY